ncbi:MAG: methionyl-tRNA formyltransferase [Bacteriovorax sp.]|nr:methionyl-tRNA formyltransferase [Bacteriovorax sp.]
MTKKLNVVFCGTPDFSVPTLEELYQNPAINLVGVITMPDRPAGRGQELKSPPVAEFAKTHNIRLFQIENINREEEILTKLETMEIDFYLVLAFAQFLGSRVLTMPKLGCFNIHTSILPKYRGAAPIQYALLNGDSSTGVSIQKMVKTMDAGDLVHFDEINIAPDENGESLYNRLKLQAGISTKALIEKIQNNKLVFTPQNPFDVSFAPTLKKEDGFLNFKESDYKKLHNQVRALDPWPGTYCYLNSQRLKVYAIEKLQRILKPGETSIEHGFLSVGLSDCSIRLTKVQLEGKKICTDTELLNGLKNKGGEITLNP